MTNQKPVLLVQYARTVNASCSDVTTVPLFFSSPPPPPLHTHTHIAIIPDTHPLGTFENQDGQHDTLYLNDLKKKIEDCEQSNHLPNTQLLIKQQII